MADETVVPLEKGPRATVLQQAFEKALAKVEEAASWKRITKKYPELLPKGRLDILKQLYNQYLHKVQDCTKQEFDLILQDNDVVEALNRLDADIEKLGSDVDTARSRPLTSSTDMAQVARQARVVAKQTEKARLQAELEQLQQESRALEKSITQAQKTPTQPVLDTSSTLAKAAQTFESEMHANRVAKLESFAVTLGES
eukprot:TRINITY_DN6304_c0_g1_i1.p1 TRINITY_DN6304_c0_g1~~TRINITY_DN6304_c0_g1_i1.p1  ORF type:complete len:199 (+),score=41.98 TRINITY_DN6304_c0_g1_i1:139-735(+)